MATRPFLSLTETGTESRAFDRRTTTPEYCNPFLLSRTLLPVPIRAVTEDARLASMTTKEIEMQYLLPTFEYRAVRDTIAGARGLWGNELSGFAGGRRRNEELE